jgi:hypothetical protein
MIPGLRRPRSTVRSRHPLCRRPPQCLESLMAMAFWTETGGAMFENLWKMQRKPIADLYQNIPIIVLICFIDHSIYRSWIMKYIPRSNIWLKSSSDVLGPGGGWSSSPPALGQRSRASNRVWDRPGVPTSIRPKRMGHAENAWKKMASFHGHG